MSLEEEVEVEQEEKVCARRKLMGNSGEEHVGKMESW